MSYDSEVELDTSGSPGASHGYVPEFDHIVVVNEFKSSGLVYGTPDLSSDLGEHCDAHPVVLHDDGLPFLVLPD